MSDMDNKKKFETLLKSTNREGIDNLIEFIKKSDFYTAPASTRFHSCHKGGLLEHSLNVYDCLNKKMEQEIWKETKEKLGKDGVIICSLLHDLCKTYFYKESTRNVKVDGVWKQVPYYEINDLFPYGHGEKSVMMIEEFIKLKPIERYTIRWHMGFTEPKESWNSLGKAIEKYPSILAINEADLESTYLLETES